MKKTISILIILGLLFSAGCTKQEQSGPVRVGTLKGATSVGLLSLMEKNEAGESDVSLSFEVFVAIDELVAKIASGEVDIATVPANMASILYSRTKGEITVININTLGVLYILSARNDISSIADLKGKTVYLSGKGTVPDLTLQYLLAQNNISLSDLTIEYKTEQTEAAAALASDKNAVALLPQPFAAAVMKNSSSVKINLDLTKEWENTEGSGSPVTGVTVVRNQFLRDNPETVKKFLAEHKTSAEFAVSNPDETAVLAVKYGIIDNEAVAKDAIPLCSTVCISDSAQMKALLGSYLNVLFGMNPETVGGSMPEDNFYYKP